MPHIHESRRLGCGNVWFILLGILDILAALALSGVYFKVREFTSSLDKVETVPTYANAIMLMCTGILTIVLFIRRESILLWPTGTLSIASLLFFATCAMLSGIQTTNSVSKIVWCEYHQDPRTCECYLEGYHKANATAQTHLIYEGAPNCDVIVHGLRSCLYALCALYVGGAFLALGGFVMVLVVHNQQRKQRLNVRVNNSDYLELLRSSSFASQHSNTSQNLNRVPSPAPLNNDVPSDPMPSQPVPQRITAIPMYDTVPKRNRRRKKFMRQITLPGMGFCLLNQQLCLPGEENLQLISIQRTDSDSVRVSDTQSAPQTGAIIPSQNTDMVTTQASSIPPFQRTADMVPGVHTSSNAQFIARAQGARVQRSVSDNSRPPLSYRGHTCRNGPFIARARGAQVQRSVSLEQGTMTLNGLRQYFASMNRNPRSSELSRSHSDSSHVQSQRAISIFQLGRSEQQERNRHAEPPPPRPPIAHRTQSDRTQDNCHDCREYRRWRRLCREYRTVLPPNNHMYPLPQHLMVMNYLMSAEGRGRGLAAAFEDPSTLFEPPPPYQEEGPPPYSLNPQ